MALTILVRGTLASAVGDYMAVCFIIVGIITAVAGRPVDDTIWTITAEDHCGTACDSEGLSERFSEPGAVATYCILLVLTFASIFGSWLVRCQLAGGATAAARFRPRTPHPLRSNTLHLPATFAPARCRCVAAVIRMGRHGYVNLR